MCLSFLRFVPVFGLEAKGLKLIIKDLRLTDNYRTMRSDCDEQKGD